MKFRILVREQDGVFEAWAPDLHGCRALGKNESEAIAHVKAVIETQLADAEPPYLTAVERTVEVEFHEGQQRPAVPHEGDPTPEGVKGNFMGGLALLLLGITGIVFCFMTGMYAMAPLLLFAPIVIAAFGVLGIVMGLAYSASLHRHA